MIFLTAPLDVQQSPAYESALKLVTERYGPDEVIADRALFTDMKEYNKTWKQVYDLQRAVALYLLAREDGTIGHGTYRQWKRLCKKHGVPASLLLPQGKQAAEVGEFTVSVIEESERSDKVFAVISPEPARSGSASGGFPERSNTGLGL